MYMCIGQLSKNSPGCTIELRNLFWDTEISGRSDVPIQYYCHSMLLPSSQELSPKYRDGALKVRRGHLEENKLFRTVFTATEEEALLQSFKNFRNVGSQKMDVRAKIILGRRKIDDLRGGTIDSCQCAGSFDLIFNVVPVGHGLKDTVSLGKNIEV